MALKVIPHDAVNQIFDAARIVPGTTFRDDTTESGYVVLKSAAAILQGHALTGNLERLALSADDIEPADVGSTVVEAKGATNFITGTNNLSTFANRADANGYQEYPMVYVSAGAGAGQNGIVTIITADELVVEWITSDDGKLKTALDATSLIRFYVPWLARPASAAIGAETGVVGYAQRDIPAGKYFAALTDGQGLGKQPAGAAAIAANTPLRVNETTAGTLEAMDATHIGDSPAYAAVNVPVTANLVFPIMACATMKIGRTPTKQRWS